MRICPKCSSKFGDELNFCLTCGAMLEAFAEEPPRVPPDDPSLRKENEVPEIISIPTLGKESSADKDVPPPLKDKASPTVSPDRRRRQCTKCGSTKVIPSIRIRDQGQHSDGKLSTFVDADPEALIFKDRVYSKILADICGECGHVELRAENPSNLYNHYLQSKGKQRT